MRNIIARIEQLEDLDESKLTPSEINDLLHRYEIRDCARTYRELKSEFMFDFWVLTVYTLTSNEWLLSVRMDYVQCISRFEQMLDELLSSVVGYNNDNPKLKQEG